MLIVCDTGPLRYLCEIGAIDVLPKLYGSVLTTPQVMDELRFAHFPQVVIDWANQPPGWLDVQSPLTRLELDLDDGEASAISLAHERSADRVLIDERKATKLAQVSGLIVTGTLGVIAAAGARGLIDFEAAIAGLTGKTRFRFTPDVIAAAREEYQSLRRDQKK